MNKKSKIHKRMCPQCEKEIIYNSSSAYSVANKRNSTCQKCKSDNMKGDGNHFYGKNHSEESINKYIKTRKENYHKHKYKTKEFREKQSINNKGKNNSMYGRSFYDVWLEKYGKEEADIKLKAFKKKQSINMSGSNNPMYGKPSPKGSGNGWSGWYNGWFFRSLLELSYMVSIIERFNLNWKSAESNNLKIEYLEDDINRNYFADFLIEDRYLIECKPKKLWNSKKVKLKKDAAIEYCKNRNLKYKIVDIRRLTTLEIYDLYIDQKIKFTEKYEEKYRKKYIKC